jgi:DNA-binding NtrC family response regulator
MVFIDDFEFLLSIGFAMLSISTESRPTGVPGNSVHESAKLQRHVLVLIVSPNIEVCRALRRTLDGLLTDLIVCSTETQAEEVLSKQTVDVVFCDEHLPDGSYDELIHAKHWDHRIPRVAVTTRTGEWDLCFEAVTKGAFDVIRSPWYAADLEMGVIRAPQEEGQLASSWAGV